MDENLTTKEKGGFGRLCRTDVNVISVAAVTAPAFQSFAYAL